MDIFRSLCMHFLYVLVQIYDSVSPKRPVVLPLSSSFLLEPRLSPVIQDVIETQLQRNSACLGLPMVLSSLTFLIPLAWPNTCRKGVRASTLASPKGYLLNWKMAPWKHFGKLLTGLHQTHQFNPNGLQAQFPDSTDVYTSPDVTYATWWVSVLWTGNSHVHKGDDWAEGITLDRQNPSWGSLPHGTVFS